MTRIKGFDGLRAVAVLAVFGVHRTPWLANSAAGGFGVTLFFALSGWLVCSILHKLRGDIEAGAITVVAAGRDFFARRALRILPAYYAVLVFFCLLALAGHPVQWWNWDVIPYHAAFLTNIWYVKHDFQVAWGGHFWSLAVEGWFYLMVAPVLLTLPRQRHIQALAVIVVLGYLRFGYLCWAFGYGGRVYVDFLTNFSSLALGGLVGIWIGKRQFSVPPILGAIALTATFGVASVLRSEFAQGILAAVWGPLAVLVVASTATNQESAVTRVLEIRPLIFLGVISYGFYIIHNSFHIALRHFPAHGPISDAAVNFIASVVLAALSFTLLENPVRRFGSRRLRRA